MLITKVPLNITIDKELAQVFRLLARLKYGDKKGSLSEAASEALVIWCKDNLELIQEDKIWLENFFDKEISEVLKKGKNKKEMER